MTENNTAQQELLTKGIELYKQGKWNQAVTVFKEAISSGDATSEVHGNLAKLYRKIGQIDDAIIEFRNALDISPEDISARMELGYLYAEMGKHMIAIEEFKEIRKYIESDEDMESIDVVIDDIIAKATARLESSRIDNNDYLGHKEFADSCLFEGMTDIAIDEYKKALEIQPKYLDALKGLGISYFNKEKDDWALECFNKCLEIDPENGEIYENIADIHIENDRCEVAIEFLNKASQFGMENDAELHERLGDSYLALDNKEKAFQEYKKCIELEIEYATEYGVFEKYFSLKKELGIEEDDFEQPKSDYECSHCGHIRSEPAKFCPECGKPLDN